MASILRCLASGIIRRCAASGKILRCGQERQWQTSYTNAGCGTCSDGVYPGDWSSGTSVLSTEVDSSAAGTVVIDADNGTAISYGEVYATGSEPDEPDTSAPTVTHAPCDCTARWYAMCGCVYGGAAPGCVTLVSGPSTVSRSTSLIVSEDGGCDEETWPCIDAFPFLSPARRGSYDYCRWCSLSPGGSNRDAIVAGPFCSEAESDAWIAANCAGASCCESCP